MRIALVPSNQVGNQYHCDQVTESAIMRQIADHCCATLRGYRHVAATFHIPGDTKDLHEMMSDAMAWEPDLLVSPHSNAEAHYDLGILTIVDGDEQYALGTTFGQELASRLGVPFIDCWKKPGFIFCYRSRPKPAVLVEINAHDTAAGCRMNVERWQWIAEQLALTTLSALGQNPQEDVMTPEQADQLAENLMLTKRLRLSAVAESFRGELDRAYQEQMLSVLGQILNALGGDAADAAFVEHISTLEAQKKAAVQAERQRLGL